MTCILLLDTNELKRKGLRDIMAIDDGIIRKFETGATRDTSVGKPDYEAFMCPLVVRRYGEYMTKHQKQSDGTLREGDNWQKGIPRNAYMKSAWRHFHDWWLEHRGYASRDGLEEALCALLFNVSGYLHEILKVKEARRASPDSKK